MASVGTGGNSVRRGSGFRCGSVSGSATAVGALGFVGPGNSFQLCPSARCTVGFAPSVLTKDGLKYTHTWIKAQIDELAKSGKDLSSMTTSKVMTQEMVDKSDMGAGKENQ